MAQFRVTRPYTMPMEEVREAAEGLAANLERQHGVRTRWDGDKARIKGAGVDGQMSFHDGVIEVSVKLGMLTSMFESAIKREIQTYLDEHVT